MFDNACHPELLERLDTTDPGPALAALLAELDPAAISEAEHSAALAAMRRQESWTAALKARLVGGLVSRLGAFGDDPVAEVGAVWRIGPVAASRVVNDACLLMSMPAAVRALAKGRLGLPQLRALLEVTRVLPEAAAEVTAERVCGQPDLDLMSAADTRAATSAAAIEVDPAAAEKRRTSARNARRVELAPVPDGMAMLTIHAAAEDAAAAMTVLTNQALAAQRSGDDRPLDHLRVEAAITRLTVGAVTGVRSADSKGPSTDGVPVPVPVAVRVTVPLATLVGAQDAPGELAGYGPITATHARELAAQADVWTRLLTDPGSGRVCDHDSRRYRIPPAVREFVMARDVRCTHPGCTVPAERCDLDHAVPFPAGATCACNLAPLCRRHHNAKTHGRWQIRLSHSDGRHVAIAPSGRVHVVAARWLPGPSSGPPAFEPDDPATRGPEWWDEPPAPSASDDPVAEGLEREEAERIVADFEETVAVGRYDDSWTDPETWPDLDRDPSPDRWADTGPEADTQPDKGPERNVA